MNRISAFLKKPLLGVLAGVGVLLSALFLIGAKDPPSSQNGLQYLRDMQSAFHVVAAKVVPTVVEIRVVDVRRGPAFSFNFNPFDFGTNPPRLREYRQQGLGSGVMVERRGDTVYVLTNNHVAGSAAEIQVRLSDNRTFPAALVGKDENKDLALVSFKTKDQVPLAELGDSDSVQVGDWVLAVGNPLGFTGTITAGIVSAVGRDATLAGTSGFTSYIQTDAAINQGNSGGALVNIEGKVIGINTWIASTSGGNIGLGFAIPINNAKKDINDFITKGKVEYGWLGVNIGNASAQLAKDMRLPAGGSLVSAVLDKGPAARAGLLPGDFITALNGTAVKSTAHLLQLIGNMAPGQTAELSLIRNTRPLSLRVTLDLRPAADALDAQSGGYWPGFSIDSLSEDIRSALNVPPAATGAVVIDVLANGRGEKAGLRPGDIITAVNGSRVENGADFFKNLNLSASQNAIELTINRNGNSLRVTLNK